MRMFSTVSLVALAGVLSAGCLRKEVTQTIHVAPESAVWSVIERDVRSDEKAPASRIAEEHEYFLAAAAGRHPVAHAFRRLGAQTVKTSWLRRDRPYAVLTEARFASLEHVFKAVLRETQIRGAVTVVRTASGCGTRLTLNADLSGEPASGADSALDALISDLDDYRLVLTAGRFVAADGFRILDEGSIAVPDRSKTVDGDVLSVMLEWVDDGCELPTAE
jgi:hypothetical protein